MSINLTEIIFFRNSFFKLFFKLYEQGKWRRNAKLKCYTPVYAVLLDDKWPLEEASERKTLLISFADSSVSRSRPPTPGPLFSRFRPSRNYSFQNAD